MKKLIILLVVCTFFFINLSKSQVFTNYSVDSANTTLCDNAVHAIAIDADSNLWFGTSEGLLKFEYGPQINSQSVTVTQSGAVSVSSLYDLNITIYPKPVKDHLNI